MLHRDPCHVLLTGILLPILDGFDLGKNLKIFVKEFLKGFLSYLASVVHRDPCHVLLAGILLPILDGDQGAMRFSAATGFFLSRLFLARSVR